MIAPSRRLRLLWAELLSRAREAGVPVDEKRNSAEYYWAAGGGEKNLVLISWSALVRTLSDAVIKAGDTAAHGDLVQLGGLCQRMDDVVFTPLTSEELTGSAPMRDLQFMHIVDQATHKLVTSGLASRSQEGGGALYSSSGRGYTGQYLAVAGVTCLLRLSWTHWAGERATPIWLQVGFKGQPPASAAMAALAPLAVQDRAFEHGNAADVAIHLPVGTDLDEVVDSVVAQVARVGDLLRSRLNVHAAAESSLSLPKGEDGQHTSTSTESESTGG